MNQIDPTVLIQALIRELGETLVAAIAGTTNRTLPEQWAAGTAAPTRCQLENLTIAQASWTLIVKDESDDTARQWFIAHNPWLDESPVDGIRQGRHKDVLTAAMAFANDSFSG